MPDQPVPSTHLVRPMPAQAATQPLLARITQQSLDEDYLHVAERRLERRRAGLEPELVGGPPGRERHRMAGVAAAVFGLLVAVAAVQTARDAPVTNAGRAELIKQITARRSQVVGLQTRQARLRAETTALGREAQTLGQSAQAAQGRERPLQAMTGFGALSGPGVRASVDDSPDGGTDGQVRDVDLSLLVDGLWSAGAEGIAINGNRLTVLSSIRNSSVAIRVNGNNVSLSPPYVVSAVGDPRDLQADFATSVAGESFQQLVSTYGIRFDLHNVDQVDLPAAPPALLGLRSAREGRAEQKPPTRQEDHQ